MPDLQDIQLLILDVDGVLTDGRIIHSAAGDEVKHFHVRDGSGVKYWQRAGLKMAWITGRESPLVARRAAELGVETLRQGALTKRPVFDEVLASLGVAPEATAVVGDDLPDLPLMRVAGFSACPADAVEEVRAVADYVCRAPGGAGCVREVIEHLLKAAGRWEGILARYVGQGDGETR